MYDMCQTSHSNGSWYQTNVLKILQNSSQILDPKMVSWWFPIHSVVVLSWGPGGPQEQRNQPPIHRSAIAPRPAPRCNVFGGRWACELDPGEVTGSASTKKWKKKMAGLVLFQVFDIVLMPSVPSRFVELLAIKPSSTQTSQNCPESRVVWLDCVASHITLICSCLAPLLKQKLCQSRSEVSVIG